MKPKTVPFESYADLKPGDKVVFEQNFRSFYWGSWRFPYYFRRGPVVGTHKWGHGGWYRHYRCHQNLRELYAAREEDVPRARIGALRHDGVPPDPWCDEKPRRHQKNWKKQRKTQYKI